jgi:MFS family permease
MIFMAESPRWFITVGRREEAGKALAWFRGTDSVSNVQQELRDLEVSVAEAQSQTVEFKDLLHPSLLKPTLVSLMLMLFQQLSGVNAVIFYLKEIFQESGSDMDPHLSSSIVGGVQIVATLAGALLVDRLGRRILLVISDVGMTLSLVALGAFFSIATEDRDSIGWLPLVSLMVFISAFSIGFGPIPWMILGEILPPRAKGLASAIATSFNWTLAFLVGQFFADIKEGLGINWCYFSFAIVCVVGTIYILTIVPETKGKSLDEIQALFGPPAPSNVVGKDNRSYEEDK